MSSDAPNFDDLSFQQIAVKQIVEVDKEARDRYGRHYAKPPAPYAERLSLHEIQRLLVIWPVTVVPINSRDKVPRYRVVAGLKTWAIIQLHSGFQKIPCFVLDRNSRALKDRLNTTELVTCQGLMRSEAADADWVYAHDSMTESASTDNTGPPKLKSNELSAMLRIGMETLRQWRKSLPRNSRNRPNER